jgi:MraZ protein
MPEEPTVGKIFAGTFPRTVDAKHRVSLPSDWKFTEDDAFYLVPSLDGEYLAGMLPAEFAAKQSEIRAKVPEDDWPEVRRGVFGAARELRPDKQGRVLIPDDFCKTIGLVGNALFIGVSDSFEIWDAKKRTEPATKPTLSDEAKKALKRLGL